ncbi:MAG TPA: hypothetical protein VNY36_09995 [Bacteroidia bacterium]|nr:hypothetical protein [Bacteroidia bacterium]
MKTKLFILSISLFVFGSLSAHVITVSNNAVSAGHFSNLQIAIDSANAGDTVYVMGSPTAYSSYGEATFNNSNIYITTRITLIGAGYNVTGTQNNWVSYINGYIYIDSTAFTTQLSGTKILGMDVNGSINQAGIGGAISNIDIERTYVNGWIYVFGHNWNIINNNVYGVQPQYNANVFIQNNFLYTVEYSNQTSVVISNNNFVINGGNAFYTVSNALIANNIFFYVNPIPNTTSCVFSNNLSFNSSAIALPPAGNTGSGDINPATLGVVGFTDATITNYASQSTVWNYNWKFKAASPGHNGGTDGTDIGVYGGAYPYPNMSGATRIPQMTLMNVGAIVPVGGTVPVNFKARVQN